jgi:hypothetical protein
MVQMAIDNLNIFNIYFDLSLSDEYGDLSE